MALNTIMRGLFATCVGVAFCFGCGPSPRSELDQDAETHGEDAGPKDEDGAANDGAPDGADAEPVHDAEPSPDASTPCDRTRVDTSSPPISASWRYGGGVDYPDRPPSEGDCVIEVETKEEFEAALEGASDGDVIFVSTEARIDLTDTPTLCIPAGVTLSSDRGIAGRPGGLLYVTRTESRSVLRACGDDVRVSGLRLFGHEPGQCPDEWYSPNHDLCEGDIAGDTNCRDCMPRSRGIRIQDANRLEVDNCEIAGFTYGAIELIRAHEVHVHHNEIHHNQRQGLGYGVVLSGIGNPSDVLIDHNRFDYNRHSVAGSGAIGQSYEARHNLVLPHANGHVFDMHGISESAGWDESTHGPINVAGTNIKIHQNTVLPTTVGALVVRGVPTEGSWLYDNCLARTSASEAAWQTRYFGDFYVDQRPDSTAAPNLYGQAGSDCEPTRFCTSSGGAGPWRYLALSSYSLASLGFGDFDGDGITDVLRPDGTTWHWLSGGVGGWSPRNTSSAGLSSMAFGDFDGDGRTDVFQATGSVFRVSDGAASPWRVLRNDTTPLSELSFGDFDGDGSTDVFRTTGTHWEVSYGGSANFVTLNTSSYLVGSLVFGDFDGDGNTDVFRASNGEWSVSYGGSSGWTNINTSGVGLSSLRFADVDGDGVTDVLRPTGDAWDVVWGGTGGWQRLSMRSYADVAFGDFDGDGVADTFRTGCH